MVKRTIVLDGALIPDQAEFWRAWARQIDPKYAEHFGHNSDAFHDAITGGGPGFPGECTVIIRNYGKLAEALGPERTLFVFQTLRSAAYESPVNITAYLLRRDQAQERV